jgi:hypothetical protein
MQESNNMDYGAIAAKYGGTPAPAGGVNYASIAAKYGGTASGGSSSNNGSSQLVPTAPGVVPNIPGHEGAAAIATGTDPRVQGINQGTMGNIAGQVNQSVGDYAKNVWGSIKQAGQNMVKNVQTLGNTPQANPFNPANNDLTTAQGRGNIATRIKATTNMLVQNTGEGVSAVFSPITELLKPIIQGDAQALQNSPTFQKIANSPVGNIADSAQTATQNYSQWAQANPNKAKDLEAASNTIMALIGENPANQGGEAITNAAKSGAETIADTA